jgi:hypothetical protein
MTKHFIAVEIVNHRLVGMPHVVKVNARPERDGAVPRGIDPIRGIATAVILSAALWIALIGVIA